MDNAKIVDILIVETGPSKYKIWSDVNVSFLREIEGIVGVDFNSFLLYATFQISPRFDKSIVLDNLVSSFSNVCKKQLTCSIRKYF